MSPVAQPILLVEDDPNDILLMRRAFKKASVETPLQVVHDGEAAVAYLAGQGVYTDRGHYPLPSLMLLDLKLPRKSGFGVLAWMRQQAGLEFPPTVALTSSGEPAEIRRAYELGVASYYVKPASLPELVDLVNALLRDFPHLRGVARDRPADPSAP